MFAFSTDNVRGFARAFLALAVLACSASAFAQGYKELPIDQAQSQRQGQIRGTLLQRPSLSAAEKQIIKDYYEKYAIARWTQQKNAHDLSRFRRELLDDLYPTAGPTRDYFLQLFLRSLGGLAASEQYSPASRYNAMLAIGQLEQQKAQGMTPAVMYPPARNGLLQVYQDAAQPDFLRVAALVGLVRHTTVGISDQAQLQNTIVPLFLSTAQQTDIPDGRQEDVHLWFREVALNGLGAAGWAGADGNIAGALIAMARDEEEKPEIRFAAARALGSLNLSGAQGVTAEQIVGLADELILGVVQIELDRIEADRMAAAAGTGSSGYGGSSGYESGYDEGSSYSGGYSGASSTGADDVENAKRRVLDGLNSIKILLFGPTNQGGANKIASAPETAKRITDLNTRLESFNKVLIDPRSQIRPMSRFEMLLKTAKEAWLGEEGA